MSNTFFKNGAGWLVAGLLLAAVASAAARPPMPTVQVPNGVQGEAAITALGGNIDAVAAHYGKSAEALRSLLRSDRALRLDGKANLYYVCEGLAVPAVGTGAGATGQPIFPLSQTFLLHSKPGSTRTIYLDFNGHTISGTAWNATYTGGIDIVAPPWDIDGNPAVFGAVEQAVIQQVWFQVAEDYAPFDVDVTTEYPGEAAITRSDLSDQVFGTRALISPISSYIAYAGGIAYLGAFDEVGDYHKPALIFPENLGNDAKDIAEAVSHEVGHNLNLHHDGTTAGVVYYDGQGDWAPIMGVGYNRPIVQWSKGEYANANNPEDDLAIITATGLNYRSNDFGSSLATATALPGINPITNGVIARTDEKDFFSFQTGPGTAQISLSVSEVSGNLHALVTVYDSVWNTVTNLEAVDNGSIGVQGVALSVPVVDGKYYVCIAGKGSGDPVTTGYSSYASLGQYVLSITNPPGSGTVVSTPVQPYGTNLAVLNGGDPNGNWYLFIQDDTALDTGVISNGWLLTLTTANLVGAAGDLEISMSASASTVGVGSNVVYVVGVTNYGPSASSNVVVADTLPFGFTVISSNKTQGTVTGSPTALTWNVGTLTTNAGARLTFTGKPAYVGNIVNAATASATTTDPNPDNDSAEVAVNVTTSPWPPSLSDIYTDGSGVVHFSITNGVGAGAIIIQAATNLVSPVNWVSIYTNTPPFDFSYDVTTNYPARFYRALVGP
ncbi:MAG: hypothetical protein NTZ16_09130 [Verrucomicrobia bacterium]|nr:hypothetical protein [Verrucomicrobiota bacterium]